MTEVRTMTGTVKALEWSTPTGRGSNPYFWAIGARTETLSYRIDWEGYGLSHTNHEGPYRLLGIAYDSIEAAKAAAQADYERRILSAITASASEPAKPEMWQWREVRSNRHSPDDWKAGAWRDGRIPSTARATDFVRFEERALYASPVPASEPEPVAGWQKEAKRHAIELGQCSIFAADAGPAIAKSMTDAAAWLRNLADKPVPTPDGTVEATRDALFKIVHSHIGNEFTARMAVDEILAALETPWQKPGRAAQAQAEETPDFPADEQSGETSHGAVTDAMVEAALKAQHDYHHSREISYEPDGMRAALSAALSHPADGWRGMSSAPKDGSRILTVRRFGDNLCEAAIVRWSQDESEWWDDDADQFAYPDLWMPLAAPAAKPEGE